ncbi:site-specific integrase [Sutcliffiella sp. NC1]|uniref:site-specific integrase n=1 Tax=Sutcliffiella sp. NC1 TaxID=3004096 RepID=UPI0022DD5361|nr:site-specific integrase [Sutcliffiella sp. NC1]WBL15219.1 site-specific integrase [Sutcliffiella sp. NC1]
MGDVILYNEKKRYEERIKKIRFKVKKYMMVDEEDLDREFIFIVLQNLQKKRFKISAFSNFFYKKGMINNSFRTKENYAKIIVLFLNYIFFDKYDNYKLTNIEELQIKHGNEFLRDYSYGDIGQKNKTRDTVEKAEAILNKFYRYIYEEIKGLKYLNENEFYKSIRYGNGKHSRKKEGQIQTLFSVMYPNYQPPQKLKHIPLDILIELIDVCGKYYPKLKLALCLQAFGGLRAGEVCNVSLDKILIGYVGNEFSYFNVDLRYKTRMRTDFKRTGDIKKPRVQPIHPAFLSYFKKVYDQHLELIKGENNHFGAIFLNRSGEAMTESSYNDYFKKIVMILIDRLSGTDNFYLVGQANILLSGRVNKHILRHFFTQHISEYVSNPNELAYWRGDSSLNSSITYLTQNPKIDEKIRVIQKEIYNKFSNNVE